MLIYESERSQNENYIYSQEDVNLVFGSHLHNSFEFIFVREGSIILTVDDKRYVVSQNECALILPNQIHSYETVSHSASYLCVFSVNYAYKFYSFTKDKSPANSVFRLDCADDIVALKDESCNYYLKKSIFYKIISAFDSNTEYISKDDNSDNVIQLILCDIGKNFAEINSLKELADKYNYSYNYLSSLINSTLHVSFPDLLNMYRISHAQYLINNTDKSLTEIAMECGFDSIRNFNRNFVKFLKQTPSHYKNS